MSDTNERGNALLEEIRAVEVLHRHGREDWQTTDANSAAIEKELETYVHDTLLKDGLTDTELSLCAGYYREAWAVINSIKPKETCK